VVDPAQMSDETDGNGPGDGAGTTPQKQTHVTTAVGATTVDSRLGDPFLDRASEALMAGDWTTAEDAFASGIAASPMDARLHGGLAIVAIHQEDWDRAVSHGRQATALPGASVEVHNNLGWALERRGDIEEAARAYITAFDLDPTAPPPIRSVLRLGQPLHMRDEEPGDPVDLGTLQRLELYEHLAGFLRAEPPGNTWRGSYVWAMERGAPWGRLLTWLVGEGIDCDRDILEKLARRDEYLGEAIITGMVLGEREMLARALEQADGIAVVGPDDTLPKGGPEDGNFLVVRLDATENRAQIPAQRTHAGVVFSLLTDVLDQFGPEAAATFTVDPAAHLGPRRVWMINPLSEVEVVGSWAVEDDDGNTIDGVPVPDDRTVRAGSVLLPLRNVERQAIDAVLEQHDLVTAARSLEAGGGVIYDADAVGRAAGWAPFLDQVAGWLHPDDQVFAVWRAEGVERLAVLTRADGARRLRLVPDWPEDQGDLNLPMPPEVQLLARAIFQAPRAGRLLGTRAE